MTSSDSYKLWLWDSSGSTWREVDKFTNMLFEYQLNHIPTFEATLYITDSNVRSLLSAGTPFRITKLTSSDGTVENNLFGEQINSGATDSGSRQIIVGTLNEPVEDGRTSDSSGNSIIWQVTGDGYAERLKNTIIDRTSSISNNAGSVVNTYVTDVNSRTSNSLKMGTQDTGPSINVIHRREELLPALIDIATIGDGTDKFTYYIHVDDNDTDRVPRVNYVSPTNSFFETSDPTGGTDDKRVLDAETESRSVNVITERERLTNAVRVTFGGRGSGSGESTTSFQTDSTSISTFERREANIYAPWIQDSSTATTHRDTVEDMFDGADIDGNYNGILRAEATLKDGEIITSSFNAVPGDVVAVEDEDSNTLVKGRFLGFQYNQMREATTIYVGLPRVPFGEDYASTKRGQQSTTRSMNITDSQLSTETTQDSQNPGDNVISQSLSSASIGTNSSDTQDFSISTPNDFDATHIWYTIVNLTTRSPHDGPAFVKVHARDSGAASQTTIFRETWTAFVGDSNDDNTKSHCFPFAPTESTIDTIRVEISNNSDVQTLSVSANSSVAVRSRSEHDVDLSHTHNL